MSLASVLGHHAAVAGQAGVPLAQMVPAAAAYPGSEFQPDDPHGSTSAEPTEDHSMEASANYGRHPPYPPHSITATPGNKQVTLSWTPDSHTGEAPITEYVFSARIEGDTQFSDHTTVRAPATSHTLTGLEAGTPYEFVIAAVNQWGRGAASDQVTATPMGPPGEPQNLTATTYSDRILLDWDAPDSDGGIPLGGYTILKEATYVMAYHVNASITSYEFKNLIAGTTYGFVVTAWNDAGFGSSAEVTVTTKATPPGPVKNLKAKATGSSGTVNLEWDAPDSDGGTAITNYIIYGRIGEVNPFSTLGVVSGDTTSHTISNLHNNVPYQFIVMAKNDSGTGSDSNIASATPRQYQSPQPR